MSLTKEQRNTIFDHNTSGLSVSDIAADMGLQETTIVNATTDIQERWSELVHFSGNPFRTDEEDARISTLLDGLPTNSQRPVAVTRQSIPQAPQCSGPHVFNTQAEAAEAMHIFIGGVLQLVPSVGLAGVGIVVRAHFKNGVEIAALVSSEYGGYNPREAKELFAKASEQSAPQIIIPDGRIVH